MLPLLYATFYFIFFFNDTATSEIYTLSLHDDLPILAKYVNKKSDMDLAAKGLGAKEWNNSLKTKLSLLPKKLFRIRMSRNFLGSSDSLVFSELFHSLAPRPLARSEERFSRNAETDLVCRLLLEKKKPIGVED